LAIEAIADLAHPALMLRSVGGFLLLFTHSWAFAGGSIVQVTATVLPVHCTPAQAQRIKACISPAADTIERAPLKTFDRETTSVTVYADRTVIVRTIAY